RGNDDKAETKRSAPSARCLVIPSPVRSERQVRPEGWRFLACGPRECNPPRPSEIQGVEPRVGGNLATQPVPDEPRLLRPAPAVQCQREVVEGLRLRAGLARELAVL